MSENKLLFMAKGKTQRGFTLIELIIVMVVVAVIAATGTQFVLSSVESYQISAARYKLVGKGRQALERISRQLSIAVPNSVRVTNGGACVEFLPISGGATYVGTVPDTENSAPAVGSLNTGGYTIDFGTGRYAVIAPLFSSEIYNAASDVWVNLAAPLPLGNSGSTLNFSAAKSFLRNSINRRVFISEDPQAFCITGAQLRFYQSYATPANTTGVPGGAGVLVADSLVAVANPFVLAPGTEDRNSVLNVVLRLASNSGVPGNNDEVDFVRQVFIRNVP